MSWLSRVRAKNPFSYAAHKLECLVPGWHRFSIYQVPRRYSDNLRIYTYMCQCVYAWFFDHNRLKLELFSREILATPGPSPFSLHIIPHTTEVIGIEARRLKKADYHLPIHPRKNGVLHVPASAIMTYLSIRKLLQVSSPQRRASPSYRNCFRMVGTSANKLSCVFVTTRIGRTC